MKLLLGLWLPILLVGLVTLVIPAQSEGLIGVSTRGWALFLCAPITSLLLHLCARRR